MANNKMNDFKFMCVFLIVVFGLLSFLAIIFTNTKTRNQSQIASGSSSNLPQTTSQACVPNPNFPNKNQSTCS
jgi:hypothetical protein